MRNCCVYKLNGVGNVGAFFTAESLIAAFFTAESLIEHFQVVPSVNSASHVTASNSHSYANVACELTTLISNST